MRRKRKSACATAVSTKKQIFSLLFLYKRVATRRVSAKQRVHFIKVCIAVHKRLTLFILYFDDDVSDNADDQHNENKRGVKSGAENIPDHFATGKGKQHQQDKQS